MLPNAPRHPKQYTSSRPSRSPPSARSSSRPCSRTPSAARTGTPDMPLHRLTTITIGVPNVAETAAYYAEFGLIPHGDPADASFATPDGGEQLRLVHAPTRRLVEL